MLTRLSTLVALIDTGGPGRVALFEPDGAVPAEPVFSGTLESGASTSAYKDLRAMRSLRRE